MFTRVPKLERGGLTNRSSKNERKAMQNDRGDILYPRAGGGDRNRALPERGPARAHSRNAARRYEASGSGARKS